MAKPGFAHQQKKQRAFMLAQNGDIDAACQILEKLCRKDRRDIESWMTTGVLYATAAKYSDAVPYFKHVCNIRPDIVDAFINLSSCYASQQNRPAAIKTCQQGLEHFRDQPDLLYNLACMQYESDDLEAAETNFLKCIEAVPGQLDCYLHLADLYREKKEFEQARKVYNDALAISPGNNYIMARIASTFITEGNNEQALELLLPLVNSDQTDCYTASVFSKIAIKNNLLAEAIDFLERSIRQADKNDEGLLQAHLSLGNLLDKQGQYDKAFAEFKTGNNLKNSHYDAAKHSAYIDYLENIFTERFLQQNRSTTEYAISPVFIVGMPRSGTTLVEQILCTDANIYGAGELHNMFNISKEIASVFSQKGSITGNQLGEFANSYIESVKKDLGTATLFTDKMPDNFLRLGFINLLFPGSRIIHCLRNPLDTCLSCYTLDFIRLHEYAYKLEDLGHYYNEYRRLMKHWQSIPGLPILDIHYEDLVNNQESATRRLLDFCGLDWNEKCLDFHNNKRVAMTASNQQVRQPMYDTSIERWRHYEKHLQPLINAIDPEYLEEAASQ